MSSLIYLLDEDQIVLATDTLAVDAYGGFVRHTSKALFAPHLNTIVCGLGIAGIADRWFVEVNSQPLHSIHDVHELAAERLPAIWEEHQQLFDIPEHLTSTIYNFGLDPLDGSAHAYVHRSTHAFRGEHQRNCRAAKPTDGITSADLDIGSPKDFVLLMQKQRIAQEARPVDSRIYIGGHVQLMHLTANGCMASRIYSLDE